MGVGTNVTAKAPINTLIAGWQEQAVPVKDTLGHWWGGGEIFPRAGTRSNFRVFKSQVRNWSEIDVLGVRITTWQQQAERG